MELKPLFSFENPLGLPVYLLLSLMGFVSAYLVLARAQTSCDGLTRRRTRGVFLLALIAGYFCANIADWFLYPDVLRLPVRERFASAGFSFYYGMLAFFGLSALLLRMLRLDARHWLNEIVPSVLIAHAFGRVGCSLEGCCYGVELQLLGRTFDFPARELEAIGLFLLFVLFVKHIKNNRLFWYFACYSTLRFLLEFGRGDDRGFLLQPWLSPAQLTSVFLWAALLLWVLLRKTQRNRNA